MSVFNSPPSFLLFLTLGAGLEVLLILLFSLPFSPSPAPPTISPPSFSIRPLPTATTSSASASARSFASRPAPAQARRKAQEGLPLLPSPSPVSESPEVPSTLVSRGPLVLFQISPELPESWHYQDLEAKVLLEFEISETGHFQVHLLQSSQLEELDTLALSAAQQWKFLPAQAEGAPIPSRLRLRMGFEVR